jgi:predicted TPR repeat methyltransferase
MPTELHASPSKAAGDFFQEFADTFDTFYDGKRSYAMRWIDQRFRRDMFLRFAWTFEHLGDLTGKSGVDIGCGSGPYIAEAFRRGAAHLTALDPAGRMLELTQERIAKIGKQDRLTVLQGFFPQVRPPGRIDFAIVMGVMDYVEDKLGFMKGLRGLGDIQAAAVSFPSKHWFRSPIRKIRYNLRKCPLWFYTEPQIRQLGEQAGFSTVEIRKIPGAGMDYHVCLRP